MLAIASTFVCTGLANSLVRTLPHTTPADLRFLEFTQLSECMPTLSHLHLDLTGTAVLFRIQDWLRADIEGCQGSDVELRRRLRLQIDEFTLHLGILSRMGKQVWLLGCPSIGAAAEGATLRALSRTFLNLAIARARTVPDITILTWPEALSAGGDGEWGRTAFDLLGASIGQQISQSMEGGGRDQPDVTSDGRIELADYLRRLNVQVTFRRAVESDRDEVEHILRTVSAFSLTGDMPVISNGALHGLLEGRECFLISVSDRHSSYGSSGLVILQLRGDELGVEAFALSCPVLGKQVECAVLEVLGSFARDREASQIVFPYQATARNQPMLAFLEQVAERRPDGSFVLHSACIESRVREVAVAIGGWTITGITQKKPRSLPHTE